MINSFWLLLCFLLTAICSAKEENCDNMALDLGLVIDSSSSISRRNWERMKYFAKDFISNVFMSINDTRISIIVYSTSPSFELSFNEPYSSERVDNLRHQRGLTYINKALIMANQSMFTEKNGMRSDSTKAAIVFTDGLQTKRPGDVTTPLNVAADVLSKRAIDVFAVGIGRNIDVNELLDIASSARNVYRADGFDTLDVLTNQVTCPFYKWKASTYLRVFWNGNLRQFRAYRCSRWYFTFNGRECYRSVPIDGIIYQDGNRNILRIGHIEGYCGTIPAGLVNVEFRVGGCRNLSLGNAFTGYRSYSRIVVEEVDPPQA